jgi:hypothetical protein
MVLSVHAGCGVREPLAPVRQSLNISFAWRRELNAHHDYPSLEIMDHLWPRRELAPR